MSFALLTAGRRPGVESVITSVCDMVIGFRDGYFVGFPDRRAVRRTERDRDGICHGTRSDGDLSDDFGSAVVERVYRGVPKW